MPAGLKRPIIDPSTLAWARAAGHNTIGSTEAAAMRPTHIEADPASM